MQASGLCQTDLLFATHDLTRTSRPIGGAISTSSKLNPRPTALSASAFICAPPYFRADLVFQTSRDSYGQGLAVFEVGQRYATDHLAVGRLDDVHDLAAVGFQECSVDVVLRNCLHRILPVEDSQLEETASSVSEHYRNDASAIPLTISP